MNKPYSEMTLEELEYCLPYIEGEMAHGYHSEETYSFIVARIRELYAEKNEAE